MGFLWERKRSPEEKLYLMAIGAVFGAMTVIMTDDRKRNEFRGMIAKLLRVGESSLQEMKHSARRMKETVATELKNDEPEGPVAM